MFYLSEQHKLGELPRQHEAQVGHAQRHHGGSARLPGAGESREAEDERRLTKTADCSRRKSTADDFPSLLFPSDPSSLRNNMSSDNRDYGATIRALYFKTSNLDQNYSDFINPVFAWILFGCNLCQFHIQTSSDNTVGHVQCVLYVSTHILDATDAGLPNPV